MTGALLTLEEWQAMSVDEKSATITKLTQDLYAQHRQLVPKHPWILLYVLPREQKIGSLFIPQKHHKVSLEGLVLQTWGTHNEEKGVIEHGVCKTRVTVHRSIFKPGDHVLFPHWSGLPIPGMDEKYFRVVKEEGWSKNEEGGIYAMIDYDEQSTSSGAVLRGMLEDFEEEINTDEGTTNSAYECSALLAAKIEDRFFLIDKQRTSVTLSALHGK